MSSYDLNKLIEEALSMNAASDVFKEQLLRDSTAAFTRGRVLQLRLRVTELTLVILFVTTTAFVCGRLSISGQVTTRQVAVQTIDNEDEGITVSKDLVAWLDAARFFARLGMDERAALSYKQASDLIPYDALPESQQAGFGAQHLWAGTSVKRHTTDFHLEEPLEQMSTPTVIDDRWRELGLSNGILSKITTQHFGRSQP
jgi:hypothetical protein